MPQEDVEYDELAEEKPARLLASGQFSGGDSPPVSDLVLQQKDDMNVVCVDEPFYVAT